MSATFAYEDPLSRAARDVTGTKAQTVYVMKEMGRNMWSSGKGFAKVGALYAGVECCIEGVSCHHRSMGSANESTGRNTI
jgi:import inner membrane translocase subunit TIM22